MKRILIIGCGIEPVISANVICVQNILNAIKEPDWEIHFMCDGESQRDFQLDNIFYHVSERCLSTQKKCILRRLFALPETEFEEAERKTKQAIALTEKFHFQYVVGLNCPFSNIEASLKLKKKWPSIFVIGYYLDSLEGLSQMKGIKRKVRDFFAYSGEHKALKKLDLIFMPVATKPIYLASKYRDIQQKLTFLEFPSFVSGGLSIENTHMTEKTNLKLVYIGKLSKDYRNPICLLKALDSSVDGQMKVKVDIYGQCDDSLLSECSSFRNVCVNFKGSVSHDAVCDIYKDADAVLNISNKNQYVVPSKIFEIAAQYKPMIVLVSNPKDYALKYYKRYEGAHIVYEYMNLEEQVPSLRGFLKSLPTMQLHKDVIDATFAENTPSYVGKTILNAIKNLNHTN